MKDSELRELGVMRLDDPVVRPMERQPRIMPPTPARDVFITRLHLRYDREHFPDDLRFQITPDRSNFRGRYIVRHSWDGNDHCKAADRYRAEDLPRRQEKEAHKLADVTGWQIRDIRKCMGIDNRTEPKSKTWWRKIWPDNN